MSQLSVIHKASEPAVPVSSYDYTKWNLPDLIKKRTDVGSTPFIGPCIGGIARPVEQSAAIPGIYPWSMQWANKTGFYSTGTVAVSGTTVTGSGTAWESTGGVPIGAKIGFGSTDPFQITTWYDIADVQTDTTLILGTSPGTISAGTSFVINRQLQIDWVFLADNATAAATRRIQLYTFNRETSVYSWRGFVTLTFPTATNHTIKGIRMTYKKYTDGTVTVSGANVTGSGTAWQTSKMTKAQSTVAGSRIGFGSKDPTQIKTWYYINALTSDTALTICTNAAGTLTAANITVAAGSDYVIEDLRAIVVTTNATAANGGLFVAKGLCFDKFTTGGTTILGTATTGFADDQTNVYWIGDASTNTNTAGVGLALEPESSWTSQFAYVLDTTGGIKVYKYNIRGALSITTGAAAPYKDISQYVLQTGSQAVTGTVSVTNNGRFAITSHGPISGSGGIYFVTTTRVYGIPTANITSGSTTFLTYTMTEVPPGSTTTFAVTGGFACIEYASTIDRFVITSTGAAGVRSYITQFRTDAGQADHIFLTDDKQIDQSTADANTTPHPTILAVTQTPWAEGGILHLAGVGTTAQTNLLHAVPIGVDWTYAATTGQRLITPAFATPNCSKYVTVFAVRDNIIGNDIIGKRADAMRFYYRTSGITDNSGSWNLITEPNDLTGVAGATMIQFMVEFKGISDFCVPARLFLVGVVYEDTSTDSHFTPSAGKTDIANKRFAWKFSSAFGSAVPRMKVQLYNADTGALLLTDDTTTLAGTWEKSTNGGSTWGAYNTTNKSNETTYIRFTPASLGDNISVKAVLTQY